jgi:hypothetical protein
MSEKSGCKKLNFASKQGCKKKDLPLYLLPEESKLISLVAG